VLVLGLLIACAAGTFAALVVTENTTAGPGYDVSVFGNHLGTLTTMDAFLAGIALALVFSLGIALAVGSITYHRRLHAERLAEMYEADRVRAERDALAARLGGLGVPIDQSYSDANYGNYGDDTAPLPPSIFPWVKP
jgi:hypothetical protein